MVSLSGLYDLYRGSRGDVSGGAPARFYRPGLGIEAEDERHPVRPGGRGDLVAAGLSGGRANGEGEDDASDESDDEIAHVGSFPLSEISTVVCDFLEVLFVDIVCRESNFRVARRVRVRGVPGGLADSEGGTAGVALPIQDSDTQLNPQFT